MINPDDNPRTGALHVEAVEVSSMTPVEPPRPLPAGVARVRWRSRDTVSPSDVRDWRAVLDDEERARADRLRSAADRDTFIIAHALLRSMLSEATGLPVEGWRYVTDPSGKPELAAGGARSGLRFSLTHTRDFAACAIARDDVGIDAEALDETVDPAVAEHYFTPAEARAVRLAPPARQLEIFLRLWTLKEAFVKATGEGLGRSLASFSFTLDPVAVSFLPECDAPSHDDASLWRFAEHRPGPDWFLALAVKQSRARGLSVDAGPAR
jgi:4'-phosphopantetheinyl transferase